jgi:hypothetical protein
MTADLPAPILAELHAANARLVGEGFDGPRGQHFNVWFGGRGVMVLIEHHPDGKLFSWQPLNESTGTEATVDALRAYFASEP